ncbi:hypothetical protein J4437_03310 [Candidatus Woesearchaeota archaeon]|nr:hypothetical protein [Candidatus Woesearchaeota archaeon]
MNTQINVRLPEKLLLTANAYAEGHGFGSIQELIKESLREKMFGETLITKEELILVKKLAKISEKNNLYGTEEEMFKRLRRPKDGIYP